MKNLKVEITDVQECVKKLVIEIPEETVAEESKKAFGEVKKSASVQGFRKGHVPGEILKKIYGKSVLSDVGKKLINDGLSSAISKQKLSILGAPTIEDAKVEEGKPISFTAVVEIMPQFEIPDFSGWPFERRILEITDETIKSQTERMRESKAEMAPVENRPTTIGDFVFLDYTGTLDDGKELESMTGKNQQMLVNDDKKYILADFCKKLVGLEKGEESEFSITLPKKYPDPELAGKKVAFKVKVNVIKEKKLPEFTDEFVKAETAYGSVKEFREKMKEMLENRAMEMANIHLKKEIMARIKKEVEFHMPPKLVEEHTSGCASEIINRARTKGVDIVAQPDFDKDVFDKQCREEGESRAREYLIIDNLAKKENIRPDEKELKKRLEEYHRLMSENRRQLSSQEINNTVDAISFEVFVESVYSFLLAKVKITDKHVSADELERN